MDEKEFKVNEWELISPLNISIDFNNHDGLKWDLLVCYRNRGMPIGSIIQSGEEMKFESNHLDKEYSYRMMMSGRNVLFFRRKFK